MVISGLIAITIIFTPQSPDLLYRINSTEEAYAFQYNEDHLPTSTAEYKYDNGINPFAVNGLGVMKNIKTRLSGMIRFISV